MISSSASCTASSFGRRVLPTATIRVFIDRSRLSVHGQDCMPAWFLRRRVWLGTLFLQEDRRRSWSGIRESNSRLHLGKVAYYHYTNPAIGSYVNDFFLFL